MRVGSLALRCVSELRRGIVFPHQPARVDGRAGAGEPKCQMREVSDGYRCQVSVGDRVASY